MDSYRCNISNFDSRKQTSDSQDKKLNRLRTKYLKTKCLKTKCLKTKYLKTKYLKTKCLKTKCLKTKYLKTKCLKTKFNIACAYNPIIEVRMEARFIAV